MVVLYHFAAYSHLVLQPLVRNADLFVDFFFVLSGFVIMASYGDKLRHGYSASRFLLLRLGRVYPLHAALIVPFALILAVKSGTGTTFWEATATNTLLLHGLGLSWIGEKTLGALNFPSWSISAEFAAYVLFAATATLPQSLFRWLIGAAIVFCPLAILLYSPELMNTTYDFGIVRCLYGFALGIVCFEIHTRFDWTALIRSKPARSLVEATATAIVFLAVGRLGEQNHLTVAVPILFGAVVLVFARESGTVSRVLLCRPWQAIGTLSYSIYMVHALVQVAMRAAGFAVQHVTHRPVFTAMRFGSGMEDMLGVTLWQGDAATLIMFALTTALAALTYRTIEEPARLWSRRLNLPPQSILGRAEAARPRTSVGSPLL